MRSEARAWAIVGFTALIWILLVLTNLVTGGTDEGIKTISDLVPWLLGAAFVFERWLWRFLPGPVRGVPILAGTWRGTLTTLWVDPKTKVSPPSKTVYLAVEQTLTTISVRLITNESESDMLAGSIVKTPRGAAIAYLYQNVPGIAFRQNNKSPIHYGAAVLHIIDGVPIRLEGEYWAERKGSVGSFSFDARSQARARSFAHAEGLTYVERSSG